MHWADHLAVACPLKELLYSSANCKYKSEKYSLFLQENLRPISKKLYKGKKMREFSQLTMRERMR